MARVLSLWRSIEKKSLNLRLEGKWVGIYTKIHRPFASLELARCVKHQTRARQAYCRGFESRLHKHQHGAKSANAVSYSLLTE